MVIRAVAMACGLLLPYPKSSMNTELARVCINWCWSNNGSQLRKEQKRDVSSPFKLTVAEAAKWLPLKGGREIQPKLRFKKSDAVALRAMSRGIL